MKQTVYGKKIGKLDICFSSNKMTINTKKTKYMFFHIISKTHFITDFQVKLGENAS